MKITIYATVFCVLISSFALAQPTTHSTTSTKLEDQVIPATAGEELLPTMTLDQMVNHLRSRVPGFNAVVIRAAGVPNDYPMLPQLMMKNLTVGQFIQFLEVSYPGLEISKIEGPSTFYSFKIVVPTRGRAGRGGNITTEPDFSVFGSAPSAQLDDQLHIYNLNEIVDFLALRKTGTPAERAKQAIGDVLSLIQAAVEQAGPMNQTLLKVHEPTRVFMFKGSIAQVGVVEQVLATLKPSDQHILINSYNVESSKKDEQIAHLQAELAQLQKAAASTTRPKE